MTKHDDKMRPPSISTVVDIEGLGEVKEADPLLSTTLYPDPCDYGENLSEEEVDLLISTSGSEQGTWTHRNQFLFPPFFQNGPANNNNNHNNDNTNRTVDSNQTLNRWQNNGFGSGPTDNISEQRKRKISKTYTA